MRAVFIGRGLLGAVVAQLIALPSAWAIPTVVVDPGHGGAQLGARTKDGVLEKNIALAVSKELRRALEAKSIRVVMTREEDQELDLEARVDIANKENAAVYVSIHCNYAPVPERRGVETYILAAQATDDDALLLAHLEENGEAEGRFKSEEEFGGGIAERDRGELDFILADLERSAAHRDSALLARMLQDALGKVRGLRPSRGLRQAPFKVLKGAKMAAVLVEVGYLSNAEQGRFLTSGKGQQEAAQAVAQGVLGYLANEGVGGAAAK